MIERLKKVDNVIVPIMERMSHRTERFLLATVFIWFGTLKVLGETSATSIVAKSVYWFDPNITVPILGVWEVMIGALLTITWTLRLSVLLVFLRLPGTLLALVYHYDECFNGSIFLPTIQGQYLLKEMALVGAALVIGGTVNTNNPSRENKIT